MPKYTEFAKVLRNFLNYLKQHPNCTYDQVADSIKLGDSQMSKIIELNSKRQVYTTKWVVENEGRSHTKLFSLSDQYQPDIDALTKMCLGL